VSSEQCYCSFALNCRRDGAQIVKAMVHFRFAGEQNCHGARPFEHGGFHNPRCTNVRLRQAKIIADDVVSRARAFYSKVTPIRFSLRQMT
jgi:hypothetical protein